MIKRNTQPAYTHLVMEYLTAADDLRTAAQIREELSLKPSQIIGALRNLQRYHAVDCIEMPDCLWWFATPEEDQRRRRIKEHKDYKQHAADKGSNKGKKYKPKRVFFTRKRRLSNDQE